MAYELPKLFAVLGDPVAHSKSPRMQMAGLAQLGLPHTYVALRVVPEQLKVALQGARALGFSGLNLTVPHKHLAVDFVDELSPRAARIGAVNTVEIRDGKLIGHNTDAPGFAAAVGELLVDRQDLKRATVLGSGGAAVAVIDGLIEQFPGLRVQWIARKPETVVVPLHLRDRVELAPYEAVSRDANNADLGQLLVNTSTVGMSGGPTNFPVQLQLEALSHDAKVVDIVYPRPAGGLLDQAQARGHATQDGLPMLLWQGALALEIWLGHRLSLQTVEAMRVALQQ